MNEIQKAYRKLALLNHPDKSKKPKEEAEAQFRRINQAYNVLSDPDTRKLYSIYGEACIDRNGKVDRNKVNQINQGKKAKYSGAQARAQQARRNQRPKRQQQGRSAKQINHGICSWIAKQAFFAAWWVLKLATATVRWIAKHAIHISCWFLQEATTSAWLVAKQGIGAAYWFVQQAAWFLSHTWWMPLFSTSHCILTQNN